jgi:hypothetical protein
METRPINGDARRPAQESSAMVNVIDDKSTIDALQSLAAEYEALADLIERDAAQSDSAPD